MNMKNEKGMVLIWFLLLITILLITSGGIYGLSFQESRLVEINKYRNQAFYIAEAGLDKKLKTLRGGDTSNIASTSLGAGSYSVTYNATTKQIRSTGVVNGVSRTVVSVVTKTTPPGVKGAITSAGNASFSGDIQVDGRDHDNSGNLNGATGTYGVSTGGTVTQSGSSDIGGNGIAPSSPANPASIQQNASDNAYTTPEELLGVAAGSLDQYKTSTTPSLPMSGIVYYTGSSWIAPDFGSSSSPSTGILIVHNATADALLKNVHGTFIGLIIADNLIHVNGTAEIIGGIIAKTSTGTTGDGSAEVKYSSTVLNNLPSSSYSIVSWEDTQNTAYTYS